jgi:hypothetical protein
MSQSIPLIVHALPICCTKDSFSLNPFGEWLAPPFDRANTYLFGMSTQLGLAYGAIYMNENRLSELRRRDWLSIKQGGVDA